jgi:2-haloacid dehalogenase
MEWFLAEVCSPSWHAPHDPGVPTAASCAELASRHPEFSELIWAWSNRSEDMIGGVDLGSVDVLRSVRQTGLPSFALTNMEEETYPLHVERFPFGWFDGTVVSGRERVAKPEPAILRRLLDPFHLTPNTTLMIDDTNENLDGHHFWNPDRLVPLVPPAPNGPRERWDSGPIFRRAVVERWSPPTPRELEICETQADPVFHSLIERNRHDARCRLQRHFITSAS